MAQEDFPTFKFEVEGRKPFTCRAYDKVHAYKQANAFYPNLPQGAWMETLEPNGFRWALGDFFD